MSIERLNYFNGFFIKAADMTAEQSYHRGQIQRHNLFYHTDGVIDGLGLTAVGAGSPDVMIEIGHAMDAEGNMLVVDTPIQVDLTGAMGTSGTTTQRYLLLYKSDTLTDERTDTATTGFAKVREDVLVEISHTAEGSAPTTQKVLLALVTLNTTNNVPVSVNTIDTSVRKIGGAKGSLYTDTLGVTRLSMEAAGVMKLHDAAGTSSLTVDATGNVGIGTSTPAQKLDIDGQLVIRGGVIRDSDGIGRFIFGGGQTYLRDGLGNIRIQATDAGEFFLRDHTNVSQLYLNSNGYLGVGTTSPAQKLDVNGDIAVRGGAIRDATGYARFAFASGNTLLRDGNGQIRFHAYDTGNIELNSNTGTKLVTLTNAGDLGVGTTTPAQKLDVNGEIAVRGGAIRDSGNIARLGFASANTYLRDGSNQVRLSLFSTGNIEFNNITGGNLVTLTNAGNLGVGVTAPAEVLDISGNLRLGGGKVKDSGGVERISMTNLGSVHLKDASGGNVLNVTDAGSVGIGVTNPTQKLDVSGYIKSRMGAICDTNDYARFGFATGDTYIRDGNNTSRISIFQTGEIKLNATNGANHVMVLPTGEVGIGTQTPTQKLDVNGALRVRGGQVLDSGDNPRLDFSLAHTKLLSGGNIVRFQALNTGELELFDHLGNSRLQIDSGGKVFLGATGAAGNKLSVNGHIHTTDALKVDGMIKIGGATPYDPTRSIYHISTSGTDRTFLQADLTGNLGTGSMLGAKFSVNDGLANSGLYIVTNGGSRAGTSSNGVRILSQAADNVTCLYASASSGSVTNFAGYFNAGNVYIGDKLGIGTEDPGTDALDVRGRAYASGGWQTTNADYGEYFEAQPGLELTSGTAVVLDENGLIRPAQKGEIPIGITTKTSAVIGNSYKEWPEKYLKDELGDPIMEEVEEEILVPNKIKTIVRKEKIVKKKVQVEVPVIEEITKKGQKLKVKKIVMQEKEIDEVELEEVDVLDEKGNVIGKEHVPVYVEVEEEEHEFGPDGKEVMVGSGKFQKVMKQKINPDYDPNREYTPRENRPEWYCVGLLGQLRLKKGEQVAPNWVKIKDISKDVSLWLVK